MKTLGIISATVFGLVLGIAGPAYAQQDQHDEKPGHTDRQPEKRDKAKPDAGHAQPQRQPTQQHAQQQQQQDQHNQQQARQQQNHQSSHGSQAQQRVQQSAWQEHRAQNWQSDHRTWQQRGGYHGYRVPDDRYRGYFGPEHGFRIYGLPFLVVGGYPRFQYNGYWISTVDPWPEDWPNDWYQTDDVYVTYADNGYYLYDRRYPGAGVAVSISF